MPRKKFQISTKIHKIQPITKARSSILLNLLCSRYPLSHLQRYLEHKRSQPWVKRKVRGRNFQMQVISRLSFRRWRLLRIRSPQLKQMPRLLPKLPKKRQKPIENLPCQMETSTKMAKSSSLMAWARSVESINFEICQICGFEYWIVRKKKINCDLASCKTTDIMDISSKLWE